jgi:hypothetical protein
MPIEVHRTDLPTPDMAWVFTPGRIILIVDRRVSPEQVSDSVNLTLTWLANGRQGDPPRRHIAA